VKLFSAVAAPLRAADPRTFTGSARAARAGADESGVRVAAYRVAFEPGARTHWHIHSGPQWLFVIEGRIRAQVSGSLPIDAGPGDLIVIAPGEKHWHGATPGARGVHLAMNVQATTDWLEPVTDDEYRAAGDGRSSKPT
jgi:quercetin dioxygenase-like cupin family protein